MNIKKYLPGALLLCSMAAIAQNPNIQPTPQQLTTLNKMIALPDTYRLVGDKEANVHAVNVLKALLKGQPQATSKFSICIGEKGDKAVRKFANRVPNHPEGYYLSVDDNQIVAVGNDERGTYYALQTLTQLIQGDSLLQIEIKDYPSIRFRGVVEGFYGTPWSHKARLRQLRFYGENKMNTYIYGPKDDPYHSSPNWRLPYPDKEAKQLQELVAVAKENEVDFVWAIHPGLDIQWNDQDRKLLLEKFEKMYGLGVRSFAVFFDDISGEGTNPVKQAELLNYIDEAFIQVKKDVKPLVMCPTEYNKSWSDPAKGYLTTLGDMLNPTIQIMWTGDRVVADITKESVVWINERIKRPAYIWWNFPVSDYVRDHLLLGPVYGNDTQIADLMSGFVSNPMEHAEASKIAIYGVAAYAWNPIQYDSDRVWKEAMKAILPSASDELLFFAEHNSDLGVNGHKFRRDESRYLQDLAQRFNEACTQGHPSATDREALSQEFQRMIEVADILAVNTDNQPFIDELMPWLLQFKLLGETGKEVMELLKANENQQPSVFLQKYRHIKALQQRMFAVDQSYNQNPYQPGVKTGTKVLKPLIDLAFVATTKKYNETYHAQLDATTDYMPHVLVSTVEQLRNQPLQIKTDRILVSPSNEVVKWPTNGELKIELDKVYPGKSILIDLGKPEVAAWSRLEVSADGINWEAVAMKQEKNRLTADLNNTKVKAVRFINSGDKEQEVYLRQFVITIQK